VPVLRATLHDPPADYEDGKLSPVAPDEIKEIARTVMGDDDLAMVASLDKAINSTSLIPKFEFGGAFLIPLGTPTGVPGLPTNIRIRATGVLVHPVRAWPEIRRDAARQAPQAGEARHPSYRADPVKRHTGAARYRD
jgi:hypothetical protein